MDHVHLVLDVRPLEVAQRGDLDLVVEVADVADDGHVLHRPHVVEGDDVAVAGGGDEDVGPGRGFGEGRHLVAVHGGLERADRVDFGDHTRSPPPSPPGGILHHHRDDSTSSAIIGRRRRGSRRAAAGGRWSRQSSTEMLQTIPPAAATTLHQGGGKATSALTQAASPPATATWTTTASTAAKHSAFWLVGVCELVASLSICCGWLMMAFLLGPCRGLYVCAALSQAEKTWLVGFISFSRDSLHVCENGTRLDAAVWSARIGGWPSANGGRSAAGSVVALMMGAWICGFTVERAVRCGGLFARAAGECHRGPGSRAAGLGPHIPRAPELGQWPSPTGTRADVQTRGARS